MDLCLGGCGISLQAMKAAALLLLLLQLKPLVGAAVCFQNLSTGTECPMPNDPAPGPAPTPLPHDPGRGIPSPGCPAADFCALAPALGAVPGVFSADVSEHQTTPAFVLRFHSADPVAPPAPPPNA